MEFYIKKSFTKFYRTSYNFCTSKNIKSKFHYEYILSLLSTDGDWQLFAFHTQKHNCA